MATEFKVHIDPSYWNDHSADAKQYLDSGTSSIELAQGFKPNTAAIAAAVNAVLHETSLFITALDQFIAGKNVASAIASHTPNSTTDALQKAFQARLTTYIQNTTSSGVANALSYTINNVDDSFNGGTAGKSIGPIFAPITAGTANQILLSAGSNQAPVWSSTNIGSTTKPMYLNASGILSECDTYAGGTAVTLNGTNKAGTTATIYALESVQTDSSTYASRMIWFNENAVFDDKPYMFVDVAPFSHPKFTANNAWAATAPIAHAVNSNGAYQPVESSAFAYDTHAISYASNVIASKMTITAKASGSTSKTAKFIWSFEGFSSYTGDKMVLQRSSSGIKLSVDGTIEGTTMTATTYNATSDLRLKENVVDFVPEKSILDLPIKQFDFKSDRSHHIGCIAQDLQKICPEIVHENQEGYLEIEEHKLIYLLINEVKELKKEIEELKDGAKRNHN